jgi:nucleotide-binding universal stress UspA family protein
MVIVVGYAQRPESREALDRAIEEAELRHADLHIVRTMGGGRRDHPEQAGDWTKKLEMAKQEGDELVEELRRRGVSATFEVEPVRESPAAHLLDTARRRGADLIVIGLRHRSPVGKLILGSVSQEILLRAECPVLAVKAPEEW